MKTNSQTARLAKFFEENPNLEFGALQLHRIGSGHENGFLASFSRRIFELRREYGMDIQKTRDEYVGQTRHTFYTNVVNEVKVPDLNPCWKEVTALATQKVTIPDAKMFETC